MAKTQMTVTVSKELKEMAAEILRKNGLDMSSAINVYLAKVVNTSGIPFDIKAEAPEQFYYDDDDDNTTPVYIRVDGQTENLPSWCSRIVWAVSRMMGEGYIMSDKEKILALKFAALKVLELADDDNEVEQFANSVNEAAGYENPVQMPAKWKAQSSRYYGKMVPMQLDMFINGVIAKRQGANPSYCATKADANEIVNFLIGYLESKAQSMSEKIGGTFDMSDFMILFCREFAEHLKGM